MKTTLRYFKQHAKDTAIRAAIITFICLVIVTMVAQGVNETYIRQKDFAEKYYNKEYYIVGDVDVYSWTLSPQIGWFVAISAILTTLLPMLELSCFNNRKYLDSAFSFPISRTTLISVHLINGFVQFLAAYTVSFIWYTIALLPCADKIGFGALWSFFFISLLCSLFYYAVNAFFFSICNSSVDGFLTAAAWQFIIAVTLVTFADWFNLNIDNEIILTILWMPLVQIAGYFSNISEGRPYNMLPDLDTDNPYAMLIYLIVITLLTVAFVYGILYFFNKRRAESAGEITKTPFSYVTLLPVCSGLLIYWTFESEAAVMAIFALIFSTVGYIIYRRSVKLKVFDIVVIAACFVCFLMALFGM